MPSDGKVIKSHFSDKNTVEFIGLSPIVGDECTKYDIRMSLTGKVTRVSFKTRLVFRNHNLEFLVKKITTTILTILIN